MNKESKNIKSKNLVQGYDLDKEILFELILIAI
jgi:hypothetical protein